MSRARCRRPLAGAILLAAAWTAPAAADEPVAATAPGATAGGDAAIRAAWQRLRAHELATMHREIHGPPPAWRDGTLDPDAAVARLVREPAVRRRAIPLYRSHLAFHGYRR